MRAVTPPRTRGRGQVPHTAPPRMYRRAGVDGLLEERRDQPPANTALIARGADSARQIEPKSSRDKPNNRLDVVADRVFGLAEQLAAVDSSRVEWAAEGALKSARTDQAALRVLHVHRDIHRDDLMFRFAASRRSSPSSPPPSSSFAVAPTRWFDIIIRIFCVDLFSELIARPARPFYLVSRAVVACWCLLSFFSVGHRHAHTRTDLSPGATWADHADADAGGFLGFDELRAAEERRDIPHWNTPRLTEAFMHGQRGVAL